MKKNDKLIWSLLAALCLMVVIAGVMLLKSYNTNKSNQQAMTALEANLSSVSGELERTENDRSTLQTRVQTMTEEADQAARKAEELKAQFDAASADLDDRQKQIDTLNSQIKALQEELDTAKTSAAKDAEQSAAQVAGLNGQLTAAAEKEETLNAQITALHEELEAAKTSATKDAEQSAAQVAGLNEQLIKAKTELENARTEKATLDQSIAALNGQLTAAAEKEETLNAQITALQEELEAAKTNAAEDTEQFTAQVASLTGQLEKAQADLIATNQKAEALDQTIEALNEQLEATKSAAVKDAEQSAAQVVTPNDQLVKAQDDLNTASQKEEDLGRAIEELNEQLTAAKAAADKDVRQSVAQIATLNEKLINTQTQLEAARTEKEAQDKAVAELNEQLTAAKAAAENEAQQSAAQVTSLNEQLAKAETELENARAEKETLDQTIAALNEQLTAAQAAAGKKAEESAAQVAGLNEQLSQTQAALDNALAEKETLNTAVTAVNEQLAAALANLAAAEADAETLNAQIASLNEELIQTKASAAENAAALNAELAAAREKLEQTSTELTATQSAMTSAAEEAAANAAALEQNIQSLSAEAEELRGNLAAETQKSARLQEELDVQSAKPEALKTRLETAGDAEEISALADPILRAFRESVPADTEDGITHPVPASVLIDGQEVMTVYYDFTKAQEAKAYEAARQLNDSQSLYRIDLNHDATAALIVNGTAFDQAAFESAYAEVFTQNPAASQAELTRLTADEMVEDQVLREHAEAVGIDAEAPDMESRLWEEALKHVQVSEEDFSAALQKRQMQEDAVLASDPAAYARMLEEGQIASSVLPEGSRFVKQLIIPVDTSELEEILPELERLQKRLDEVSALIDGRKVNGKELETLQAERKLLAKQVSQLNSDRKLLLRVEQRALDKAADLAGQIRNQQITFEDAAAQAQQDASMPAIGYAVFSGAAVPEEELVAAALSLEKQGDVSEPIRLADGYHVLYYSEEISEASAVIRQARETLRQEVLSKPRDATQESLLQQWISEAEVVLNAK